MCTFVYVTLMLWFCKLIDALQAGASQFEASAGKLKRKFWWKNCKVCSYVIEMLDFHKILFIQLLEFFQPMCSALKQNICGSLNV